jgi:hypothetical protein
MNPFQRRDNMAKDVIHFTKGSRFTYARYVSLL